jgi:RNA polymerase sigma-70 factor (ECF subfamily)
LFADKYIKDMELSKDLVQDVFIKLWERDVEITSKTTVKSFLYTTVRNASLNYIRQQVLEEKKIRDYTLLESDSLFEYSVIEEDVSYKLYKAVDQLSLRSKEVVMLTVNEYSNPEIAEKMNISINTVKTLKQRSYRKLRRDLMTAIYLIFLIFF